MIAMLNSHGDKNIADCSFPACVQSVAVLNLLLPLVSPDCYISVCAELFGTRTLSVITIALHLKNKSLSSTFVIE